MAHCETDVCNTGEPLESDAEETDGDDDDGDDGDDGDDDAVAGIGTATRRGDGANSNNSADSARDRGASSGLVGYVTDTLI